MLTAMLALALAQDPLQELEELRRDIELLHGIHALQLTTEQLEKIVPLLKDTKKKTDEIVASNRESIDGLKKALTRMRDALEKAGTITQDDQREMGEFQRAVGEMYRDLAEANNAAYEGLKGILNEKQIRALSQLGRPDPLRPQREQLGRFIDQMRDDPNFEPPPDFEDRLREGIQRMAGPMRLSPKDIDAEVERITKILDEILTASGEDLAKKKDEWLSKIFDEGKLAEAAKKMGPPAEESSRRVGQWLLNPKVLKILEGRLGK